MDKLSFVMVGHVDHGKSTCCGRILVDTNNVTENDIRKAQTEAEENNMKTWWLAYLLDEFAEERCSGKTCEYIIKEVRYNNNIMNMIDVPGHNQYITQMIYGTSRADVVVLICSAKTGELEKGLKGQTYEHLVLAKSIGINNLVVAINKIDLIDYPNITFVDKYLDIKNKISMLIKNLKFKNVFYVPISAYHGINIVKPIPNYSSLLDILVNTEWTKKEQVSKINTNIIKAKCIFTNVPTLITIGYSAILHSGSLITEFVINDIRTENKKKFIIPSDKGYVYVELELPEKKELEQYIILRTSEQTIAIGRIMSY